MGNDRISIMHRVTMETLEDIKSNTQSVTPVSYTHLDVYKRQEYDQVDDFMKLRIRAKLIEKIVNFKILLE